MAPPSSKRARPLIDTLVDQVDSHMSSDEQQHMDDSLLYESESQGAGRDGQLHHAGADVQQSPDLLGLHCLLVRVLHCKICNPSLPQVSSSCARLPQCAYS